MKAADVVADVGDEHVAAASGEGHLVGEHAPLGVRIAGEEAGVALAAPAAVAAEDEAALARLPLGGVVEHLVGPELRVEARHLRRAAAAVHPPEVDALADERRVHVLHGNLRLLAVRQVEVDARRRHCVAQRDRPAQDPGRPCGLVSAWRLDAQGDDVALTGM